jgi:hypothetical protein
MSPYSVQLIVLKKYIPPPEPEIENEAPDPAQDDAAIDMEKGPEEKSPEGDFQATEEKPVSNI